MGRMCAEVDVGGWLYELSLVMKILNKVMRKVTEQ